MKLGNWGYAGTAVPDGYRLRYFETCDITIDSSLKCMEVRPDPRRAELASLLVSGGALAFVLGLAGEAPLHASAVAWEGRGLAIAAPSGGGKSTIAAILCAGGAELVTDDLLRLEPAEGRWRCHRGIFELRLRPDAAASFVDMAPMHPTADGRVALRFPLADEAPLLETILVPILSKEANDVSFRRLFGAEAAMRVIGSPRVAGWSDPSIRVRQFRSLINIAKQVPVYSVIVPWGVPLAGLGEAIIDGLICEGVLDLRRQSLAGQPA